MEAGSNGHCRSSSHRTHTRSSCCCGRQQASWKILLLKAADQQSAGQACSGSIFGYRLRPSRVQCSRGCLFDYRQEPADRTASHAPTAARALPFHWRHLTSDQSAAFCEQCDLAAVILSAALIWHRHGGEQKFPTTNASDHQYPRLDKGCGVGDADRGAAQCAPHPSGAAAVPAYQAQPAARHRMADGANGRSGTINFHAYEAVRG
mmetsp:Transcript_8120/g.24144  ORF Transcript_8120/g.24144 Transcript_8120/m.24144 type:complete len:206 (-) Transcript_8120:788-1405(-)